MNSIDISDRLHLNRRAPANCVKNNPSKQTRPQGSADADLDRTDSAASELQTNLCLRKGRGQGKNKEGEDQRLHNPVPTEIEMRIQVRDPK
jgi:hypothetical protein